jgi:phenylacetate-CoA ligase
MLVIRGVNVFPSEVEAVLLSSPELGPHYTIVLDSTGPMPEMVVVCELATDTAAGEAANGSTDLCHGLSAQLSQRLGVSARVIVGAPGVLPRTEVGKAVRLVHHTPDVDGRPRELARLMEAT